MVKKGSSTYVIARLQRRTCPRSHPSCHANANANATPPVKVSLSVSPSSDAIVLASLRAPVGPSSFFSSSQVDTALRLSWMALITSWLGPHDASEAPLPRPRVDWHWFLIINRPGLSLLFLIAPFGNTFVSLLLLPASSPSKGAIAYPA